MSVPFLSFLLTQGAAAGEEPAPVGVDAWAWPLALVVAGLAVWIVLRLRSAPRERALRNMRGSESEPSLRVPTPEVRPLTDRGWLERKLELAGLRDEALPGRLVVAQVVLLLLGGVVAFVVASSGLVDQAVEWLVEIPGGIGDLFVPFLIVAPWLVFVGLALLPTLYVRAARRERVAAVERDLPPALGLLATLAESGLGVDAGLERVAASLPPERPLAEELVLLRQESIGGLSRERCLRRMADRLDVPAVSVFVSALVHAETVGASVAETLRRQAEDVWSARKEQALRKAQTLPTRLAVPLVICFLPGLFAFTFGPAVAEFIRIAEGVTRGAGG